MASKLGVVSKNLYRALLRRCSVIDSSPAVKALVTRPLDDSHLSVGLREALEVFLGSAKRRLYWPRPNSPSATSIVKKAFRFPHESVDSDTAFEALRYVNDAIRIARTNGMLDDTAAEPPPGTGYAEVTDSLGTGVVLVAHPLLGGIFGRSVVLLTEHNNRGTFGFVLNQPLGVQLRKVLRMLCGDMGRLLANAPPEHEPTYVSFSLLTQAGFFLSKLPASIRKKLIHFSQKKDGEGSQWKGDPAVGWLMDSWLSLGGPVMGENLAAMHNKPDLGGTRVMAAADAAGEEASSSGGEGDQGGSGYEHGLSVSLLPRHCLKRAIQKGYPTNSVRLFSGKCSWFPGQLAGEIESGVWIPIQASPQVLDVLQQGARRPSADWEQDEAMAWCVEQRSEGWSRLMRALGGEHAELARLRPAVPRWETGGQEQ
eukprot:jgi/Tetstr1/449268/TSEL_036471.t1